MNPGSPSATETSLDKQQKERSFHDEAYTHTSRRRAFKYYKVTGSSLSFYYSTVHQRCKGMTVLEYGSGRGAAAVALANAGAKVVSIDISEVAVSMSQQRARSANGIPVRFCLMNAEALGFGNNTFDMVAGKSVIHHLDLRQAFMEIARVLKPDGVAVFLEPMGHNPLINAYRRATPSLRTADEHPLTAADLALAQRYFNRVETRYFTLFPLLAVPLRRFPWFDTITSALDAVDQVLFRVLPFMGRYAWQVVLELSEPRPAPQATEE